MNPDRLLQTLLRDPTAGVLLADADGGILRINETMRGMLAADAAAAPGADLGCIFGHAERAGTRAALLAALATNTPQGLFSRLHAASDDPHHAVTVTALPLTGDDGKRVLMLRITDITAQRRLEAQLAHGQKLQAIGELAGGIAHDFNNLLTAILATVEMLRARPDMDPETLADVAQITRAAERGAALVRQLLAFGRQQTLQPRVVCINTAMRDIARMLRPLLGAQVRLDLDLDKEAPLARVDPAQLDQVLVNLALNARNAMLEGAPEGGGALTLHSGHICLYRPLTRGAETIPPGRYVMLEARDTGPGIPPEVLERIFEPFFTTRREAGGTGLGLAMVHGIVRQSGGFLTADSTPGEGTSLRIYLPRHDGPADPPPASLFSPSAIAPLAATVLVVDDEDMVRDLMARALHQQGWQVLACDSAESALAVMDSFGDETLAAVISDVTMPGMDGPALVRTLRDHRPGLPAILISGYAAESLRAGLDDRNTYFLPKPYSIKALLALLAKVTGQALGG